MKHCGRCYTMDVDEEFICDTCEEHYCEECSYTFTIHYQFQGSRCYLCADQFRRNKLELSTKRDNKIKLITFAKSESKGHQI